MASSTASTICLRPTVRPSGDDVEQGAAIAAARRRRTGLALRRGIVAGGELAAPLGLGRARTGRKRL